MKKTKKKTQLSIVFYRKNQKISQYLCTVNCSFIDIQKTFK